MFELIWSTSSNRIINTRRLLKLGVFLFLALMFITTLPETGSAETLTIRGYLDNPVAGSEIAGYYNVRGWLLDESSIEEVTVSVDGDTPVAAHYGDVREDVYNAYPAYGNHNAGFSYTLNTFKLVNGLHTITVTGTGFCGESMTFTRTFTVFNALVPRGNLDAPTANTTISGQYQGWGWFLDGDNNVGKIEILVDGTVKCQATYGIVRNDVYNAFIAYNNRNGGFQFTLDSAGLTNGSHKMVVRETSKTGLVSELPERSFNVSNTVTNLTVSPNPVKLGYTATIRYYLTQNGYVTLSILDEGRKLVRTVANSVYKRTGTNSHAWDGKDATLLKLVPDGKYIIFVQSKDSKGNLMGTQEALVSAAQVPKINNVTISPAIFNPETGEKTVISFSVTPGSTPKVTILSGYNTVQTLIPVTNANGNYSATWDGKASNGVLLGDGTYTCQIEAVSTTVSTFKSVFKAVTVVENGPPQVSQLTVSPSPFKLGSGSLIGRYTLSEDATVSIDVYSQNNNSIPVKSLMTNLARKAGSNSFSWDGKVSDTQYLEEGNYRVVITAVDNSGNPSESPVEALFTAGYQPGITNVVIEEAADGKKISYEVTQKADTTVTITDGATTVKSFAPHQMVAGVVYSVNWATDGASDSIYTVQITAASTVVE
ncbi:MAG TPA: FlgD immunoglobulin-like domain containing protein, partial [Bacillota bacterium]|nr:FlgD immunoglobulin-like domain containing protein [Bacillota bacterium]